MGDHQARKSARSVKSTRSLRRTFCYMGASMTVRSISDSGPLAARVRELLEGAPVDPALVVPPTRYLPQLLDLAGSVSLAEALADEERGRWNPVPSDDLVLSVDASLAEIERRFADVMAGRVRVSSPTRMRRELRGIAPNSPSAVRVIRPAFSQHLQLHFVNLRAALATLRLDVAPRVAALGTRAARLEALDAALADAVAPKVEVLMSRLVAAVDARFRQQASAALAALPDPFRVTDLDPWFDSTGWVLAHLRFVGDTLAAVYAHEAGRIRALARAASEQRRSS